MKISRFLNSSVLMSAEYDSFRLLINFQNGRSFCYYNVPYSVFDELVHSPSPGKYYNQKIKNVYPSDRVL